MCCFCGIVLSALWSHLCSPVGQVCFDVNSMARGPYLGCFLTTSYAGKALRHKDCWRSQGQ
jgi:hypothetical protein